MKAPSLFAKLYSLFGALLLLECLGQFFLAGLMLFTLAKGAENKEMLWTAERGSEVFFDLHVLNGVAIIPATIIILLLLALLAHHPRRTIWLTAALLPLLEVQYMLADQAVAPGQGGSPLLAAFHPLNGLLILGIALWLLWRHWALPSPWRRRATV